jgi:hypothetical protein
MMARYNVLRLLTVAGCVLLLLRGPRVTIVRAHTQDCTIIYSVPNTQCVAPCTGTYTDYYALGKGFQYADLNSTPCGGTGCIQPYTLGPPGWECAACCLSNGETCTVNGCQNGTVNPCCGDATCDPDKLKCCVEVLGACQYDSDCCYTPCISLECQFCVGLGYGCNMLAPNCCTPGAQCQNSTCCLPVGMRGCGSGAPCCPGYVCQNGTCVCPMGGPVRAALLPPFWR